MNLQKRKQRCRKAWENENDYFQIDKFAGKREGRYTLKIVIILFIYNVHPDEPFFININVVFN